MESIYNYQIFNANLYNFSARIGPKAGENAVDFTATTLNGREVRLSDYFGKPIVLETGSITCPQFVVRINPMNQLKQDYPDVIFLMLYVREAHPGNSIGGHCSMDEKVKQAERLQTEEAENRTVLIDDLNGTAHKIYGSLPNMLYIIDADGKVALRSDWNDVSAVKRALKRWRAGESISHSQYGFKPVAPPVLLRVLKRAGWDAMYDFFIDLPKLILMHLKVDDEG